MFKVSVIKIETVPFERRNWEKVADSGNERDGGAVYAYATFPSTTQRETKVLEQEVEDLDLKQVIRAINGL